MESLPVTKRIIMLLALLTFLCTANPGFAGIPTDVVLHKSVLVNLNKPSRRVSIASPEIAELVAISPTQLQLNGKQIGSTTLIVWDVDDQTTFFDVSIKGDGTLLQSQIKALAPNDDIKVEFAKDTIVLSGTATNERTIGKAVALARAYAAKAEAQETPKGPADAEELSASTGAGSDTEPPRQNGGDQNLSVLNHIELAAPQQVLLEVKVAQVDKNAMKSLGVSFFGRGGDLEGFSNLVGAPSGELIVEKPDGTRTRFTGLAGPYPGLASISPLEPYQLGVSLFNEGISAVLKALVTKSLAKVLAEPNLLVNSGQVGKFLAGSKIPFSYVSGVGSISGTSIQFIDVGVKLTFKPEVMEDGMISLRIDPAEVSSISGTLAVNGYPIIDTREVRTRVRLRDGESLVLAGLLQEEAVKTMSKIPILGDIPILGALFRSSQDDIKEKELVFFITPRLVKPTPPGVKTVLPTDKPLTPEQEKELQWVPKLP